MIEYFNEDCMVGMARSFGRAEGGGVMDKQECLDIAEAEIEYWNEKLKFAAPEQVEQGCELMIDFLLTVKDVLQVTEESSPPFQPIRR